MAVAEPTAPVGAVLDCRGWRRSPASIPGALTGRRPANKGRRYSPVAPTTDELVQFMRAMPDTPAGRRLKAFTIIGWRSGLRCAELCHLEERDLNRQDYSITVRNGKGAKRRVAAMDEWAWNETQPWLTERKEYAHGALFPVLGGFTAGRHLDTAYIRKEFKRYTRTAGLNIRLHPHSLRHAHAAELWREGVDIYVISRQLGHADVATTARYLATLVPFELLEPIGRRRAPTLPMPSLT